MGLHKARSFPTLRFNVVDQREREREIAESLVRESDDDRERENVRGKGVRAVWALGRDAQPKNRVSRSAGVGREDREKGGVTHGGAPVMSVRVEMQRWPVRE